MSTSSPIPNDNKVVDPVVTTPPVSTPPVMNPALMTTPINLSSTPQRLPMMDPPKSQRGLNKPKCIKCGNVARSRCPFQSCKNCCAKAQNPCHIHVLKQTSILPDKAPPSAAPLPEQPSPDVPSTGASWRLHSIRQLSVSIANALRTRKPLTRKDAVNINKWRFAKLKEHMDGDVEAENEAFDRYMSNVSLLEETFSTEDLVSDDQVESEPPSEEEKFQKLVSDLKVKLRSDSKNVEICRKRIRNIVEQELEKLNELSAEEEEPSESLKRARKEWDLRAERHAAFGELIDKMSKCRNEEDLKTILEMKRQLLNQSDEPEPEPESEKLLTPKQEPDEKIPAMTYSRPKLCTAVQVGEDEFAGIYAEFSSSDRLGVL